MAPSNTALPSPEQIVESLRDFIERSVAAAGGSTDAVKPGHRVKFHWPPHAISRDFHVTGEDWKAQTSFQVNGETFHVEVASVPLGVFGRCWDLWAEARGDDEPSMLRNLKAICEPLFQRQLAINACLFQPGRFTGHLRDLRPEDLVRLLYCVDRDVAHHASVEIETHASLRIFTPALIEILKDARHPNRRVAQWCVLDLFEDLPSFASDVQQEQEAADAMAGLLWDATDDYARTVFKAGVVLGGHLPRNYGAAALKRSLDAPSRIGRRSAIHGLFHIVEWQPEMRDEIVKVLGSHAALERDPQLREFTERMVKDIADGEFDHFTEPVFTDE